MWGRVNERTPDVLPSMSTSAIAHHEQELRIALDPANPKRLIPDTTGAQCVLDIGCGAGQTLIAMPPGKRYAGMDVDEEDVRRGASWPASAHILLAAARGENLPFTEGSFDFVYSRVALPYMDVTKALTEMRRVLRPGGRIWLTLHPLAIPAAQFKRGNLKGRIYAGYVILNGFALHLTGRTFPFVNGRCESFQTRRGITLALHRAGFSNVAFHTTGNHFIVTAKG